MAPLWRKLLRAKMSSKPQGKKRPRDTNQLAKLMVDILTGEVKILRYLALQDSGKLITPMLADGQIHGGIAFTKELRHSNLRAKAAPVIMVKANITPTNLRPIDTGAGQSIELRRVDADNSPISGSRSAAHRAKRCPSHSPSVSRRPTFIPNSI